jgi:predicted transposase YdaD
MGDLTDTDLIEIVATALHRSGPSLNPERIDMMHARLRANAVVQELKRHKLSVRRDDCAPPASPESEKPAA